ncbi:glycosyltransferase family 4 protein [Gemmiger sp.]
MKILWVTSQVLPLVSDELGIKKSGFGGWVMNMLNQLKKEDDIELGVAMVSTAVSKLTMYKVDGVDCFIAPDKGVKEISDENRDRILKMFCPSLIHIEGNEFQIHCSFSRVKSVPVLLSLQGILSGYEPYQYGELPMPEYMVNLRLHNFISAWILYIKKQTLFKTRLKYENEAIKNVRYISGRTFWDRAHSYWINPKADYFICNRILREAFYKEHWNSEDIEEHSIFVGNGYSPLKGLHFVIDALALLVSEFPDAKVYVSGDCPIIESNTPTLRKYSYGRILKNKIKEYGLEQHVIFIGSLNGDDMIARMKKSNVYVLPSLIENSPNTLGEAMMLGMPCVSAYTGGASEMASDNDECLFYRANDPSLLAWKIRKVFVNKSMAKTMGEKARKHALITHDPENNRNMLISAYKTILERNK